ncbi:MAG: glycine cleavage system aminomethyltransferase GcvT [Verrucomicrobia bacterium]|nr:glycine cleavage system aminomethyltransferase GcvT [Verrucomicrobiota bacterium]
MPGLKQTPLFAAHQGLGGRIVDFGGWAMPVQYSSIVEEHLAVRNAAGLFDISHMGEVLVSGPGAEAFLNATLTNDARKLAVGQGQYTLMCNERGGVVDDLYAYRLARAEYLLIVNASRIDADWHWLQHRLAGFTQGDGVKIDNASDRLGAIALQGPRVKAFVAQVFPGPSGGGEIVSSVTDLKKNQIGRWTTFRSEFDSGEVDIWIGRTGYTGEDGFEVVAPAWQLEVVWDKLMAAGQPFGLKPCGLGARDTLRTEMCYPLYGHELDEHTTPLEAGLGFFVALEKGEFVGRAVLAEQKAQGVPKKCVAFKMTEKSAPPRPHYPIWCGGPSPVQIGEVVSGTQSPSLGVGIGLGYVPPEFAQSGTSLGIEIRGKTAPAIVVPKPIYRRPA